MVPNAIGSTMNTHAYMSTHMCLAASHACKASKLYVACRPLLHWDITIQLFMLRCGHLMWAWASTCTLGLDCKLTYGYV